MSKNFLRKYKGYDIEEIAEHGSATSEILVTAADGVVEFREAFERNAPNALNVAIEKAKVAIDSIGKDSESNELPAPVLNEPVIGQEAPAPDNGNEAVPANDQSAVTEQQAAKETTENGFTPDTPQLVKEHRGYAIVNEGIVVEGAIRRIAVKMTPWPNDLPPLMVFTYEKKKQNSAIDRAENWIDALRRCRVCGCTEPDCRQCIAKTGSPCSWVEKDLCSACQEQPEIKVTDSRAIADAAAPAPAMEQKTFENVPTDFFTKLKQSTEKVDITMRVYEFEGKFIAEFYPGPMSRSGRKPLKITGNPEEFDEGFFPEIMKQLAELKDAPGLQSNIDEVKQSTADSDSDEEEDQAEKEKKPLRKKSAPKKKEVSKKSPKKKASKPIPKKPAATKQVVSKKSPVKPVKKEQPQVASKNAAKPTQETSQAQSLF